MSRWRTTRLRPVPGKDAEGLLRAENQTCDDAMDPAYELLDAVKGGQIRALSDVVFELGVDEAEALRLLRNAVSHAFVARDYTHLSDDLVANRDGQVFQLTATGRLEWERLDDAEQNSRRLTTEDEIDGR
jgi:hypothetical protein